MSARVMQEALKGLAKKARSATPAPVRRTEVRDGEPRQAPPTVERPRKQSRTPTVVPSSNEQHNVCGYTWNVRVPTTWGTVATVGETCILRPNHLGDCQSESRRVARRSA